MSNELQSTESQQGPADRTVSEPQVMHSQAGHYVGTSIYCDGMWVPHSRFSDYMKTEAQAQKWLATAKSSGEL